MIEAGNLRSQHDDDGLIQSHSGSSSVGIVEQIRDEDAILDSALSQDSSAINDAVLRDKTDDVRAWAQCGGLYYLGETKCQQHTSCKQLSDFISICFPKSRPTENIVRLEL